MTKRIALFLFGLCALVVPSIGQVTKVSTGYLFRIRFVKGENLKFAIPVKVLQNGKKEFEVAMSANMKVVDVKNGIATIKGGVTYPGSNGAYDNRSEMVTNRGAVLGAGNLTGVLVVFPKQPLKIGDSFISTVPGSAAAQGGSSPSDIAKAKYTFKGFTMFQGASVAKFTFKTSDGQTKGGLIVGRKDGIFLRYFVSFALPDKLGKKGMRANVTMILQK